MRTYHYSIQKPVITKNSQSPLGHIIDIIFDPETGKLEGLLLENEKIIPFSSISKWDEKVIIPSEDFIQTMQDSPKIQSILEEKISILGNSIVNEDGEFLGYSDDILFNDTTGTLFKIFGKKYFLGIIPTKSFEILFTDIIAIEKEQILVKSTKIKNALPET